MRHLISRPIATVVALLITGCGQSGPLFLPPPEPSPQSDEAIETRQESLKRIEEEDQSNEAQPEIPY